MTKQTLQQQYLPPVAQGGTIDVTLDKYRDHIFSTLNCHRVGVIQKFNPTNQTATVQLVDNWVINTFFGKQSYTLAPIVECPVIFPFGTNGGLTFQVSPGNECLVLFNDRNLQTWQTSGTIPSNPATGRMHHMTDAICLVGLSSNPNAISGFNNAATTLNYVDSSDVVQAEMSLDTKVGITNATQSLKTLIDDLISIIQNLKTVNGAAQYPIDPTTASNLATLLTNFNALLK